MFELLRTPYRPPEDMLTFLGTENTGLVTFMVALAIFWTIVSIWILVTTRLTLRHYFGFLTLVAFLDGRSTLYCEEPTQARYPMGTPVVITQDRRTKKCTRVADRAFYDGESLGRNRVISGVLSSKPKRVASNTTSNAYFAHGLYRLAARENVSCQRCTGELG